MCHDGFLSDRKERKNFEKFTRIINRVTPCNIKVCNLTSCCGFQVQNPNQAIKLCICPGNTSHINQKWARTLPVPILQESFRECTIPPTWDRNSNITPCYGLQGWNFTQTLMFLNVLGNNLDLYHKWTSTYALDILEEISILKIKVITKLPNSEQSYKGKVQTHNYINRQNQSTTGKL